LQQRLGDLSGKRVFDFGCGTGRISQYHRERGAEHVLGVDISPQMVKLAEQKVDDPAIEFRVFDPEQADRGIDSHEAFDVATSLEVLEYFSDPGDLLGTLTDRVAEGGEVVFDFINRQNLSAYLKSRLSKDWRANGLQLYSLGQVKRLCAQHNLEFVSSDGVYMSLLPISIHSRIPVIGTRWPTLERVMNRSRLLRRFLSYRVLVTAKKKKQPGSAGAA